MYLLFTQPVLFLMCFRGGSPLLLFSIQRSQMANLSKVKAQSLLKSDMSLHVLDTMCLCFRRDLLHGDRCLL